MGVFIIFCPNCGNQTDTTAKFCEKCGNDLSQYVNKKDLALNEAAASPVAEYTAEADAAPYEEAETGQYHENVQLEPYYQPQAIILRSGFDASILDVILLKVSCFLIFPLLPLIVTGIMTYLAARGGYETNYVIIAVVISLLAFILSAPAVTYIIWDWETKHAVIRSEKLLFEGSVFGIFLLNLKILFLNIITLSIYSLLCANISAKNKYRYKHTKAASKRDISSNFGGSCLSLVGINVLYSFIVSAVCIAAMVLTSKKIESTISLLQLTDLPDFLSKYDFGTLLVLTGSYFKTAGLTYLIAFLILAVLAIGRNYLFLKWEIDNAFVSGGNWIFKPDFLIYLGIVLLNYFLTIITFGIYKILGIDYFLLTKFKYEHAV